MTENVLVKLRDSLGSRHIEALMWFAANTAQIVGWPAPLSSGDLLACRAKGIYKPAWCEYALSVRTAVNSVYPDDQPVYGRESGWSMNYFQEGSKPSSRDDYYTNRALIRCITDRVPVGVMIQQHSKPSVKYLVLGLAYVESWNAGFFSLGSVDR